MRQFAEDEIIIPDGPYVSRRFRCSRQPYTGLWFNAIDSGRWNRFVATGPTQSGKSLSCFVIPTMYHLFELQETVICGLPDMDMAADKWREDFLPAIAQSRFRDMIPTQGAGSRGGKFDSIVFKNGVTLKFMSGGGGDKSRAGFTSRVIVITETDGLDVVGHTSRESDKLTQIEARSRAWGRRKRVYMECTVSTETGRTWLEYQHGTTSKIAIRCPHCQAWVSPEREHLVGWQGAATQAEARDTGRFHCPACGEQWNDQDRAEANSNSRLLHRGQDLDEAGTVTGDPPQTDTLGFRWSAVNNLFLTAGDVAADEWRSSRHPDQDRSELEMRQFVWCLPAEPTKVDQIAIVAHEIATRTRDVPRGYIPEGTAYLTAAIDLGKYLCHWVAVAWQPDSTGHVVDYGRLEVASDDIGVERALQVTLRQFRDMVTAGWADRSPGLKGTRIPDQVFVDSGWMTPVVYSFCREAGQRFRPAIGRGTDQQRKQWYNRPASTGSTTVHLGENFHINLLPTERMRLVEIDSDYWKSWVHLRLKMPIGEPGALALFRATLQDHLAFSKHLTAETKTEEFVPGKGVVIKWERVNRVNHWFDALYNSCCAGSLAGAKLIRQEQRTMRRRTVFRTAEESPVGFDAPSFQ